MFRPTWNEKPTGKSFKVFLMVLSINVNWCFKVGNSVHELE
jgi:hypothetical protein